MRAKDFYKEQREVEEQTLLTAIDQVKDITDMEKSLINGQLDYNIYYISKKLKNRTAAINLSKEIIMFDEIFIISFILLFLLIWFYIF
jgi:hypothetical protein